MFPPSFLSFHISYFASSYSEFSLFTPYLSSPYASSPPRLQLRYLGLAGGATRYILLPAEAHVKITTMRRQKKILLKCACL